MKRLFTMAVAAWICAVAAGDAQAVVIDFETVDTTNAPFAPILVHGDYVTQGGYFFRTSDYGANEGAFVGAMFNGADPEACLMGVCPAGNLTNYIGGLNDGIIEFGRVDGGKSSLLSFDAAFITSPDTAPEAHPAVLAIYGVMSDGTLSPRYLYDLGTVGAGGTTSFHSYEANIAEAASSFLVFAYRCDLSGSCSAFDTNEGQFAFDNVSLEAVGPGAAVPEPATWAMMLLGFGGVGSVLRRQRNRLPLAA